MKEWAQAATIPGLLLPPPLPVSKRIESAQSGLRGSFVPPTPAPQAVSAPVATFPKAPSNADQSEASQSSARGALESAQSPPEQGAEKSTIDSSTEIHMRPNFVTARATSFNVKDPVTKRIEDLGECPNCKETIVLARRRFMSFLPKSETQFCPNCRIFLHGNPWSAFAIAVVVAAFAIGGILLLEPPSGPPRPPSSARSVGVFGLLRVILNSIKMTYSGAKALLQAHWSAPHGRSLQETSAPQATTQPRDGVLKPGRLRQSLASLGITLERRQPSSALVGSLFAWQSSFWNLLASCFLWLAPLGGMKTLTPGRRITLLVLKFRRRSQTRHGWMSRFAQNLPYRRRLGQLWRLRPRVRRAWTNLPRRHRTGPACPVQEFRTQERARQSRNLRRKLTFPALASQRSPPAHGRRGRPWFCWDGA